MKTSDGSLTFCILSDFSLTFLAIDVTVYLPESHNRRMYAPVTNDHALLSHDRLLVPKTESDRGDLRELNLVSNSQVLHPSSRPAPKINDNHQSGAGNTNRMTAKCPQISRSSADELLHDLCRNRFPFSPHHVHFIICFTDHGRFHLGFVTLRSANLHGSGSSTR